MRLNYYQSYLQMIRLSVGVPIRQSLFITMSDGSTKDILRSGQESCAYYVSCILKIFNLAPATYANVVSLQKELIAYGWSVIDPRTPADQIIPWSLIIRAPHDGSTKWDMYGNIRKSNYHIGFYVGDEQVISNRSDGFEQGLVDNQNADRVPMIHHFTYNGKRDIVSVLTFPFEMNLTEYVASFLNTMTINHQLEIPLIGSIWPWISDKLWLDKDEQLRAVGLEEGNILGRICGPACILMWYRYITGKSDHTMGECIALRDQTHGGWRYRNSTVGRYHQGLVVLAQSWWLAASRWHIHITQHDIWDKLRLLVAECIDQNKVLILSVSPGFNPQQRGWHLVVVRWYNRNWYHEELIINDPLDPMTERGFSGSPVPVLITDILNCWSGNWIIVER